MDIYLRMSINIKECRLKSKKIKGNRRILEAIKGNRRTSKDIQANRRKSTDFHFRVVWKIFYFSLCDRFESKNVILYRGMSTYIKES